MNIEAQMKNNTKIKLNMIGSVLHVKRNPAGRSNSFIHHRLNTKHDSDSMENLCPRQQWALSIIVELNIVVIKTQRVAFVLLTNIYPVIGVKYWTRCHEHATVRSFEYCCLCKIYTLLAILTA